VQRSSNLRLQRRGDARFGLGRWLSILLAVLAFASTPPARSAEPVAVRAGIHPGFGRLVLEWSAPVQVEGRQQDDRN
jgi:hypothetical protein